MLQVQAASNKTDIGHGSKLVLGKCYRSWNIFQITEEGLDFPSIILDVSVLRGSSVDDGDRAGVELFCHASNDIQTILTVKIQSPHYQRVVCKVCVSVCCMRGVGRGLLSV